MRGAQALVTALLVTLAVAVLAAPATAASGPPDPDAPPGASGQWLPDEEWVMERWTPFDEARLYAALHTTRPGVERWLADSRGRRTLLELARRRGIGRAQLVRRLVAPSRGRVTRAQYAVLRARTNRIVTQSHLAQHMLFHTFHTWAVRDAARRRLGLSEREWNHLRNKPRGDGPGMSVVQIARRRHVPVKSLRSPVLRAVTRSNRRGMHRREMPPAQATAELVEERWKIEYWPLDRSHRDRAGRTAHLLCDL
jgi:hypothetical protein